MSDSLRGLVALVTGAGRGIGAAVSLDLARRGARVALVDLAHVDGAEALAAEILATGGQAIALRADVTRLSDAEDAVRRTVEELGGLDVLVCNAGITRDGVSWKMSEKAWDDVIDVNLKGCFTFCRAAAPLFRAQRSGRIVTIASINGLRGKFGLANYCASKAGVIGLTRTLARELGPSGVTVNCVAPGMVRSDMTENLPTEVLARAIDESALGRIAEPEDVANAVSFLCSANASHITGVVLPVDGGQLA